MQTIDLQRLAIKAGDRVLDLGCGEGRHSIAANFHFPAANIIGLDLNFRDLQQAQTRHREWNPDFSRQCFYLQSDAEKLPFADASFDHIICSEVLEHLPDYQKVLQEIYRVLKPGGSLSLSVPRYWPEKICWLLSRAYHSVEGGHIRIFTSKQLKQAIHTQPYIFKGRHWAHALHVPYWWLRCAFWSRGEDFFPLRCYHKMLVWDLLKRPRITQISERLLNPIMGKSVVLYFEKPTKKQPKSKPIP